MIRALVMLGFVVATGSGFSWLTSSQTETHEEIVINADGELVEDDLTKKYLADLRLQQIKQTAIGSSVYLRDNHNNTHSGLFTGITNDEVEICSCISQEVVDMRGGKRQAKTSVTPYCVFPVSSIRDYQVFDVPAVDLKLIEKGCGLCFDEIVFKDGRRQSRRPGKFIAETLEE